MNEILWSRKWIVHSVDSSGKKYIYVFVYLLTLHTCGRSGMCDSLCRVKWSFRLRAALQMSQTKRRSTACEITCCSIRPRSGYAIWLKWTMFFLKKFGSQLNFSHSINRLQKWKRNLESVWVVQCVPHEANMRILERQSELNLNQGSLVVPDLTWSEWVSFMEPFLRIPLISFLFSPGADYFPHSQLVLASYKWIRFNVCANW